MKCFYHESDFDGECSAAIISKKFPNIELIGCNYTKKFPIECIQENEEIIMVDFSLPKDEMIKLNDFCKLTWIDHHKRSFEFEGSENINGKRQNEKAACELTWSYLFTERMPKAVYLLGRYDVWDIFDNPQIKLFQNGLKLYETTVPDNLEFWNKLFINDSLIENIIKQGEIVMDYCEIQNKKRLNNMSFETEFHGYKTICANHPGNSSFFNSIDNEYDIKLLFIYINNKWEISLYSNVVDVSYIASQYEKGGGHKNAAGFTVSNIYDLLKI